MGLAGAAQLGIDPPNTKKRLLTIIETDGCFADGIEVATGCTVGHRTMRLEDYGKVAATFVDVKTGKAVRLVPKDDIRQLAKAFAPHASPRLFFSALGLSNHACRRIVPDPGSRIEQTCGKHY